MKNKALVLILTIGALVTSSNMMADNNPTTKTSEIRGRIICEGEAVPYINIILKGTQIGTTANENGQFALTDLPTGQQTIVIKGIGYKAVEKVVDLKQGDKLNINIEIQVDALKLDAVVVSATRFEMNRKEAPVIVNLVGEKIFDATQAISLAEGLSFTPGLRLENNCQNCGFTQLRMNGLEGHYTQILINSKPIFSALNGVYGLEQIPASMVDRIEVVRGGGSALYGGNAIAGTVNIITKDPINNEFSIGTTYGNMRGQAADFATSFNAALVTDDNKTGVHFFGMFRNKDHFDANGDGFSEIATMKNNSFGLRAFYKLSNFKKITAEVYNFNEFRRGGNMFDKLPHKADIAEQTDHIINGLGLTYEAYSTNQKSKYSVYTTTQNVDRDSYYGAEQDPNAYGNTKERTSVLGAQYSYNIDNFLFAPAVLTTGAEFKHNDLLDVKLGDENAVIEDHSLHNIGAYAQNQWNFKWLKVLTGVRMDKNEELNHAVFSPRANVLIDMNEKTQLRLSYAHGFRAPQLFNEDLHIMVAGAKNIRHKNDPNLVEETSNSYSLSLDHTRDFKEFQTYGLVEGFYTKLNNPFMHLYTVAEDDNSDEIFHYRSNGSGSQVYGANFEVKVAKGIKFNMQMGATIQRAFYDEEEIVWEPETGNTDSIVSTNKIMKTPDNYGYCLIYYTPAKNLNISSTVTYTGTMLVPHIVDAETSCTIMKKTPNFFDMSIKIDYDLAISKDIVLSINGGIQNILDQFQNDFDKGIERDAGYIYGPLKPRTFFLGLELSTR